MNEAIVKLAEEIGWVHGLGEYPVPGWGTGKTIMTPGWTDPAGKFWSDYAWPENKKLPNPFIDANADFAVLEWMRNEGNDGRYGDFRSALAIIVDCELLGYKIGDYARAACAVLEIMISNGGQKNE